MAATEVELSAVLEALALVLRNATRLPLLATRATAVVKKKKPKVAKEKKEMTAIMIIELPALETVMARRYLLMKSVSEAVMEKKVEMLVTMMPLLPHPGLPRRYLLIENKEETKLQEMSSGPSMAKMAMEKFLRWCQLHAEPRRQRRLLLRPKGIGRTSSMNRPRVAATARP